MIVIVMVAFFLPIFEGAVFMFDFAKATGVFSIYLSHTSPLFYYFDVNKAIKFYQYNAHCTPNAQSISVCTESQIPEQQLPIVLRSQQAKLNAT